jgi:hypothetical protein
MLSEGFARIDVAKAALLLEAVVSAEASQEYLTQ